MNSRSDWWSLDWIGAERYRCSYEWRKCLRAKLMFMGQHFKHFL